jgi:glyoxylase-like metal-dependent hydrolase (beta-lactamase superfamily II)
MIEEILPSFYRLEIPLPRNPLRATNSYLIKAPERNLMVDTGMNRKACVNAMQEYLRKLRVDLWKTDFFITHLHADHLGLVSNLVTDNSVVYFNQPDLDRLRSVSRWDDMVIFTLQNGFPEDELQEVFKEHPGYRYGFKGDLVFKIVEEGNKVRIGDYLFECIATPGHSMGHMCLYESEKKILLAGDHILTDITPTIQLRSDNENPLKEYLASLGKVNELEVDLVLPGHRSIFRNCKERIQELKHHHERRANEILSILEGGLKNAYQVASRMTWDLDYNSWNHFPLVQKWFATGEAIAHLKYLEDEERVQKEVKEQKIVFSLSKEYSR